MAASEERDDSGDEARAPDDESAEARRLRACREYATALSWVQREVYSDVLSFGQFLDELDGGADAALDALKRGYGALASLRAELRALRAEYLDRQRQELRERLLPDELRVQLGARERARPGWLTIDLEDADLRWNVTWGLPLADGQCQYVYSSHLLEHLYAPDETTALLREVHRVLRPGGVARIVVPDMQRVLRAYLDEDADIFARLVPDAPALQRRMTPLILALEWAGHNTRDDCFLGHKTGFDFETLRQTLQRAGFSKITRASGGTSAHAGLCLDPPHVVENGNSLFVEAIR